MLNKKMLLSVLIIGVVATAAGAGTWAQFSDTETSSGNTLTAGTMDLQLSADGTTYTQGIANALSIGDVYPGAEGQLTGAIHVKNSGTVPGKLTWASTFVSNDENGLTEPESNAGDTGDLIGNGELSPYVTLSYYEEGSTIALDPVTGIELPAGDDVTIVVKYVIADAGNNIQSDKTAFDVVFTLNQNTV
jgi:spore coat-associated protein N